MTVSSIVQGAPGPPMLPPAVQQWPTALLSFLPALRRAFSVRPKTHCIRRPACGRALVSIEEGEDGMNNIMNARPVERAIAQRFIGSLGHEATSFRHRS